MGLLARPHQLEMRMYLRLRRGRLLRRRHARRLLRQHRERGWRRATFWRHRRWRLVRLRRRQRKRRRRQYLWPFAVESHGGPLGAATAFALRGATLGAGSRPGPLEVWDGRTENLMKQYSPPIVDDLAPWPVFTYNSMGPGSIELGSNWTMLYRQTINTPNSSTAVLTNGIGLSFTYSNKNASTGVYTAPPGAPNKLVQNADATWTETAPDGSLTNYNTGGNLATLQRSSNIWTLGYDPGGRIQYILDPVGRRSSFAFAMIGAGMRLTRYTDAVGRVTTFGYQ